MNYIDLRSDTVTMPTDEMRRAMMEAEVGDDIYEDDPTVRRLEELAAARVGKEAALLMVSGTMGNQVAIMAHTRHGDEIIASAAAHIVHYECGAPARLSGVNFALAQNPDTCVYPEDVARLTRPMDIHFPRTSLVCLENPLCNGRVVPLDQMRATYQAAKERELAVHLDGARIFNAALTLGVDAREIASCADSVMFCLSKGLCAPVGSMLCGSRAFIHQARRMRKILGGGMRQSGVLAACGILAIEKMALRLGEDHDNARYLAAQLNTLPGIQADEARVQINMVFWETKNPAFDSTAFADWMKQRGIKVSTVPDGNYRYVTHNDVSSTDLDAVIAAMKGYIAAL